MATQTQLDEINELELALNRIDSGQAEVQITDSDGASVRYHAANRDAIVRQITVKKSAAGLMRRQPIRFGG